MPKNFWLLSLFCFIVLPASVCAQNYASTLYVVAHEDDWQLFMNPHAYIDVQSSGVNVTFVYVTAGDAGCGAGPATPSPYYQAREAGAARAVRFMTGIPHPEGSPYSDQGTWDTLNIASHSIPRYTYSNTSSLFLRLPDGGGDDCGLNPSHTNSLTNLESGTISTLASVDSQNTYYGWSDLVDTLAAIINYEIGTAYDLVVNYQNPNTSANPSDHLDHWASGNAAHSAASQVPCARQVTYLDYVISSMSANLSSYDLVNKAAVFANTVSGRADANWPGTWESTYTAFLPAMYFTELGTGYSCQ